MRINWSNVGVLEMLLICLTFVSIMFTIRKEEKLSAIGKIVASLTLLSYVLLK